MVYFLNDHRGLDWYLPVIEMKLEEMLQACLNAESNYHGGLSETRTLEMFEDIKLRAEDALNLAKQALFHEVIAAAAQKKAAEQYLLN